MTQTSLRVEARIASLPIAKADQLRALAYVHAGESLADTILSILHFFSAQATPILRHDH